MAKKHDPELISFVNNSPDLSSYEIANAWQLKTWTKINPSTIQRMRKEKSIMWNIAEKYWLSDSEIEWGRISSEDGISVRFKKKASLTSKTMREVLGENISDFKIKLKAPKKVKSNYLCEVNIFDPHFWKLAWKDETGQSYDLKIAEDIYMNTIAELIQDMKIYRPEKIILTVWSDFFNADNNANTTTAGTPQDCDSRHQKAFWVGIRVCRSAIEELNKIAPVHVVVVPWNHDKVTSYHMWVVLEVMYDWNKSITIDNSPADMKIFEYGKCLISWDHGDWPKTKDVPWIIARDYPEMWWRTLFRENHRWHLHQESCTDLHWFKIRIEPSISARDAWHATKWYGSLRGAKAYIWDKERWLKAQLHSNIDLNG